VNHYRTIVLLPRHLLYYVASDEKSSLARTNLEFGMLSRLAGELLVDLDFIRSRFIQENLRSALMEHDKERSTRALRAFRIYFQWFEHELPDLERLVILGQLAQLEQAQAPESSQRDPRAS
jgi:hypothetical protein